MSTLHAYLNVCYGTNFKDILTLGKTNGDLFFIFAAVFIFILCCAVRLYISTVFDFIVFGHSHDIVRSIFKFFLFRQNDDGDNEVKEEKIEKEKD